MNEMFSEDVFLAKTLGAAMVTGLQDGGNLTTKFAVASLLKHYAMYSVPEGGLNGAPAALAGRRAALQDFLPVFGWAVRAGAQSVMSSYNTVDGEPASASHWLLSEVLRGDYGFDGTVLGDFGVIGNLCGSQGVAANSADAVRQFLEAGGNCRGMDVQDFEEQIVALVSKDGAVGGFRLAPGVLDKRVSDVLRVKARLGLVSLGHGDGIKYTDRELLAQNTDTHGQQAHVCRPDERCTQLAA